MHSNPRTDSLVLAQKKFEQRNDIEAILTHCANYPVDLAGCLQWVIEVTQQRIKGKDPQVSNVISNSLKGMQNHPHWMESYLKGMMRYFKSELNIGDPEQWQAVLTAMGIYAQNLDGAALSSLAKIIATAINDCNQQPWLEDEPVNLPDRIAILHESCGITQPLIKAIQKHLRKPSLGASFFQQMQPLTPDQKIDLFQSIIQDNKKIPEQTTQANPQPDTIAQHNNRPSATRPRHSLLTHDQKDNFQSIIQDNKKIPEQTTQASPQPDTSAQHNNRSSATKSRHSLFQSKQPNSTPVQKESLQTAIKETLKQGTVKKTYHAMRSQSWKFFHLKRSNRDQQVTALQKAVTQFNKKPHDIQALTDVLVTTMMQIIQEDCEKPLSKPSSLLALCQQLLQQVVKYHPEETHQNVALSGMTFIQSTYNSKASDDFLDKAQAKVFDDVLAQEHTHSHTPSSKF